jgi:hypothetical protein
MVNEGSRLDLGFALQVLSSRSEALIWVLRLDFWAGVLERNLDSGNLYRSILGKFQIEAADRIGSGIDSDPDRHFEGKGPMRCHRLRVNWLLDSCWLKWNISFIGKTITKGEPIAPKADLSA